MTGHDHYREVLRGAFRYRHDGPPEEIRALARRLIEPDPEMAAGGSSFAVTAIPTFALYLSESSAQRLGLNPFFGLTDLHRETL